MQNAIFQFLVLILSENRKKKNSEICGGNSKMLKAQTHSLCCSVPYHLPSPETQINLAKRGKKRGKKEMPGEERMGRGEANTAVWVISSFFHHLTYSISIPQVSDKSIKLRSTCASTCWLREASLQRIQA